MFSLYFFLFQKNKIKPNSIKSCESCNTTNKNNTVNPTLINSNKWTPGVCEHQFKIW